VSSCLLFVTNMVIMLPCMQCETEWLPEHSRYIFLPLLLPDYIQAGIVCCGLALLDLAECHQVPLLQCLLGDVHACG
jgi:hypothetical protein